MTIATDMGFEIGKLYRVINDENSSYYKTGMLVQFYQDDGSNCPWFKYVSGPRGPSLGAEIEVAIDLTSLEEFKTAKTVESSTNKPLLILYIQQQYPDDKVLKALVESL